MLVLNRVGENGEMNKILKTLIVVVHYFVICFVLCAGCYIWIQNYYRID